MPAPSHPPTPPPPLSKSPVSPPIPSFRNTFKAGLFVDISNAGGGDGSVTEKLVSCQTQKNSKTYENKVLWNVVIVKGNSFYKSWF
jgi:hypothetical protein